MDKQEMFLNKDGYCFLWEHIKSALNKKQDADVSSLTFGSGNTVCTFSANENENMIDIILNGILVARISSIGTAFKNELLVPDATQGLGAVNLDQMKRYIDNVIQEAILDSWREEY